MISTESFTSAIRSLDVRTVEKLLKSDLEIEYQNIDHHSGLHTAVKLIAAGTMKLARSREALRRMVEVLLESGRVNVEAFEYSSNTALHFAADFCRCRHFSGDHYKGLVNSITELLLKNNANINARNFDGQTPLIRASQSGCSHIVQLLLDWGDKHGAGVDVNARDMYGDTALIKAAAWDHVDVVELLLERGCLDEFQDHRGFYALHAVIHGCHLISNASSDFLALIGVLASEETRLVLDRYAAHSKVGKTKFKDWTEDGSIQEIVTMLITRGRANINSLDFRGYTVLDVALKSKLRISQNTVEKLKEFGATPSCVLLNKHTEYPKHFTLQYTDKLGKNPLHRLSAVLPELTLGKKIEIFDFKHLLNSSSHKGAFEEMTIAKDHRNRTLLHYVVLDVALKSEDISLLINVLKLAHIINERDNYGRTPLHYCQQEAIYKSLVELGAEERIRDFDEKTPRDLKQLRNKEQKRHNLPEKLEDHLSQEKVDACKIWEDFEYAYRDKFSKKICDKVQNFINRLSEEIKNRVPRFECQPVLIGSAREGTKTGLPDEFDYNFILTKLSDVCEVVPSPQAPKGFVHLKRRSNSDEYRPTSQEFQSQDDFDGLFSSGGFLLTTEIGCRFRTLYLQILSEPEFWEVDDFLEWDPHNEVGSIYDKQERKIDVSQTSDDFMPLYHPCSTIRLKLNRPIEGRYMFTLIALDIVPCIQPSGWWPEEALSSLPSRIMCGGCYLVFDQPQRNYPWVPFSDPFARISFAPAEGRIIKECSAVARAAYMVGKQLLYSCGRQTLTYVLKTCLLYCIEALKDCTSSSSLYEDINPAELRAFVEKLMLCFHEFYLQDFLPCYMMPSFHLPIEYHLKSNHDNFLYISGFLYPSFAYELYSSVCTTESLGDFCPPIPDPLNEKFNREELMRKLSIDRSYFEQMEVIYRRVQPQSPSTGQMVWSDGQSESQVRLSANRKRRLETNARKTIEKKRDFTETK